MKERFASNGQAPEVRTSTVSVSIALDLGAPGDVVVLMRFNVRTPAYSRSGPSLEQTAATCLRLALSMQGPTKLGCEVEAIALLLGFRRARCLAQQGKLAWAWRTRGSCRGRFRRGHLEILVLGRNHARLFSERRFQECHRGFCPMGGDSNTTGSFQLQSPCGTIGGKRGAAGSSFEKSHMLLPLLERPPLPLHRR